MKFHHVLRERSKRLLSKGEQYFIVFHDMYMISNVDLFFRNSSHNVTPTGPCVSHLKLCDKLHSYQVFEPHSVAVWISKLC